ncbi:MAG: ABC transporter substrate-binding protein [Alphaproteobacteria bacterium]|nr:MAG: ABC transporter substrate-binding protein [Alphaproteobacteria bacterium]
MTPRSFIAAVGLIASLAQGLATGPASAAPLHGLSAFGDLKYGPDFQHLDYVNPVAPEGGTLSLIHSQNKTSFDSLNPFILAGEAPQGIGRREPRSLVYDSLMSRAHDEPDAVYGLVAESAELAADQTWVIFTLRPEARWHDGTPMTAHDVVWTHYTKMEKGHPRYALVLRDVLKVEALGDHQVKYTFKPDGALRDLALAVATLPILSKSYYESHVFEKPTIKPPLTSGPYTFGKVIAGQSITYDRVPDYWAKDLPINVGRFNFDHVRFEYFRERTIGLEAFLAGGYTLREENTSKMWARAYQGPNVDAGLIQRMETPNNRPAGAQAFYINVRRDKFKDIRVRQALDLAFDYEWTNRAIFYGAYERGGSIFDNSTLKATGVPEGAELALLEPFRANLPTEVFGPAFVPPVTDGTGNNRIQMRQAALLLRDAGWRVVDGVLVNPDGEPLEIEFLDLGESFIRVVNPYIENLKRLGIRATARIVDSAQYQRRMEDFDFDITTRRFVMRQTPGIDQRNMWSSRAARTKGSFNIAGIDDTVVDAMIDHIINAKDRDALIAAARALDRIIMHGHYTIPQWYKKVYSLAYWDRFSWPDTKPKYSRGIIDTWWFDADKSAAVDAKKAAR